MENDVPAYPRAGFEEITGGDVKSKVEGVSKEKFGELNVGNCRLSRLSVEVEEG